MGPARGATFCLKCTNGLSETMTAKSAPFCCCGFRVERPQKNGFFGSPRVSPSPSDTRASMRASMRGPLPQFVSPRRRNSDQIGSHYARQQYQTACFFGSPQVSLAPRYTRQHARTASPIRVTAAPKLRPNRFPFCAPTISSSMLRARWICHPHW